VRGVPSSLVSVLWQGLSGCPQFSSVPTYPSQPVIWLPPVELARPARVGLRYGLPGRPFLGPKRLQCASPDPRAHSLQGRVM